MARAVVATAAVVRATAAMVVARAAEAKALEGKRGEGPPLVEKRNVTRASEAATSLTNSDASRTWLIYATRRSDEFEAIFFRHSELAQP